MFMTMIVMMLNDMFLHDDALNANCLSVIC